MTQNFPFSAIILAAGMGKRTGSNLPKVLIETAQKKPLISYVLKTIKDIGFAKVSVVVGHQAEVVKEKVSEICSILQIIPDFCLQKELRGTADAVKSCTESLANYSGPVLILYGDMPLISTKSLEKLVSLHESSKATLSMLTVNINEDNSYGRIIRNSEGQIIDIRERKDCSAEEAKIAEKNPGVYFVEAAFLFSALERIENKNAQNEFYLTDIVKIAAEEGQTISSIACGDANEAMGVNDLSDLMQVNEILRKKTISDFAKQGVKFLAPESVVIDPEVQIGKGTSIGPSVQISGQTKIGENAVIEGTAQIKDALIGDNCHLKLGTYITKAVLENNVTVGPFAQIRPDSHLQQNVIIGNFVELKNAKLAEGAKANHLTYLGDCEVGQHSNIGAGTITCNYDGVKKSRTTIGKNVFVGSNTALVAPVTLGDSSVIGAGSVITKDVEAEALALTRAPLMSKSGWARNRKKK